MDIARFKQLPILGILRGLPTEITENLIASIISSGLLSIEFTMNTTAAPELIKRAVKESKGRLVVGAGTVLSVEELKIALDAGATFIVMPTLIEGVLEYCVKNSIPVFPGALTPQEIYRAWQLGATMVKVFPAKFFGPSYFKDIKGPFPEIELLACGGVNSSNIKSFFTQGASAVAFGASIFKKNLLNKKGLLAIENSIKTLIKEFKS